MQRVHTVLDRIEEVLSPHHEKCDGQDVPEEIKQLSDKFFHSMDDDFNTPSALASVFELVRSANLILDRTLDSSSRHQLSYIAHQIREMGAVLGLFERKERKFGDRAEKLIHILIDIRNALREKKRWELADTIRQRLQEIGISLEDKRGKTVWRVSSWTNPKK